MTDERKQEIKELIREFFEAAPEKPLSVPLHIDSILALKVGGFIVFGTVTLASGAATIADDRIRSTSKAFVTYQTHSDQGVLLAVCTDGLLSIESTDGSDASEVNYLVIL